MRGRPDHGAAAARSEELYRDHGRLVGGLCRALLHDSAEGEDAAQQVFLAAHRALLNGTSPREPAAWLATIARNECWARIRTRMREPLPTAEVGGEASLSDPLTEAIRNADLAAIWSAIAALPRQQRDALLLREFGGLSYTELAGALAVSGPAVESLLFRARQGVRTRLETAAASLTGGTWLDSLLRLAGGVGGGLAPVAAKVAVVGVGAAVATGGAVVTPRMLDGVDRHQAVSRPAKAPKRPALTVRLASKALPIVVSRSNQPPAPVSRPAAVKRPRRDPSDEHRSGGSGGGSEGNSGDVRDAATSTVPAESRHVDSAEQVGGDSSSGRNMSGGGSGSDGETTSNPVLTVTVPTGDAPPGEGGNRPVGDD